MSILPPSLLIGHRAGQRGEPRPHPSPSAQALEWGPGLPLLLLMLFCLMHHREAPAAGRAREGVTWYLPRLVGQSPEAWAEQSQSFPQCGTLRPVSVLLSPHPITGPELGTGCLSSMPEILSSSLTTEKQKTVQSWRTLENQVT